MFELVLRGTNVASKLRPVKVAVLKDLGRVPVDGEITNIAKGQETELPRWLGEVLSKLNYVELRHQQLSIDDVSRHLVGERRLSKSSLTKLRDDFYSQARELLAMAKSSLTDVDSAIGIVRLESNLRDLIRLRVSKIVGTALIGAKVEKFEDNLTLEEAVLFKLLSEMISLWANGILRGARNEREGTVR